MSPTDLGKRGPKPKPLKCTRCDGIGTTTSGSGRNQVETTCTECDGTGELT